MTDAPERIWIDAKDIPPSGEYGGTYYLDNEDDGVPCIEYTRSDLTQAAVAAALEEASSILEDRGSDGWAENVMAEYAAVSAEAIRDLIPTTGTEALERIKEQVRAEEREHCAKTAWRQAMSQGHSEDEAKSIAAAIRRDSHD